MTTEDSTAHKSAGTDGRAPAVRGHGTDVAPRKLDEEATAAGRGEVGAAEEMATATISWTVAKSRHCFSLREPMLQPRGQDLHDFQEKDWPAANVNSVSFGTMSPNLSRSLGRPVCCGLPREERDGLP